MPSQTCSITSLRQNNQESSGHNIIFVTIQILHIIYLHFSRSPDRHILYLSLSYTPTHTYAHAHNHAHPQFHTYTYYPLSLYPHVSISSITLSPSSDISIPSMAIMVYNRRMCLRYIIMTRMRHEDIDNTSNHSQEPQVCFLVHNQFSTHE